MTRSLRPIRPRVGVDFHVFDGKYQGTRSHLVGLYSEVLKACSEIDFFFFLDRVDELRKLPGFAAGNLTLVRMPSRSAARRLLVDLATMSRHYALDAVHTQYVRPPFLSARSVVTIHDILFEDHPGYFERTFRWRSHWLFRSAARKSDAVLTVSEYSRDRISSRYGVPKDKVLVIGNAVDHGVFFPGSHDGDTVKRHGLEPGRYVLSVGRIEPRKNFPLLVRAFSGLLDAGLSLAIVGQRDFGFEGFERLLRSRPGSGRVKVLSDVSDSDLPALYRHALIFAYPSAAEGFGMPVLEAMACGVPVIAARATAMPEVVGNAGILVPANDESALGDALARLVASPDDRARFRELGLARAYGFHWKRCADRLATVLRALVARR